VASINRSKRRSGQARTRLHAGDARQGLISDGRQSGTERHTRYRRIQSAGGAVFRVGVCQSASKLGLVLQNADLAAYRADRPTHGVLALQCQKLIQAMYIG